jgi:hypothetical protein
LDTQLIIIPSEFHHWVTIAVSTTNINNLPLLLASSRSAYYFSKAVVYLVPQQHKTG